MALSGRLSGAGSRRQKYTSRRLFELTGSIGARQNPGRRGFSSTSYRCTHYRTLSIPHNATKSQVKSSYYKLSKLYHPDVAKGATAKEKFQAVSEAYAVLGDDRKRRAYDRSLVEHSHQTHHTPSSPHNTHEWTYERRRGATYAWEHPRRTGPSQHPHTGPAPHSNRTSQQQQQQHSTFRSHHYDPFGSPHVRRATGRATPHQGPTELDRIRNISTFWRAVHVIGVVLFVAVVGGGFGANAG